MIISCAAWWYVIILLSMVSSEVQGCMYACLQEKYLCNGSFDMRIRSCINLLASANPNVYVDIHSAFITMT